MTTQPPRAEWWSEVTDPNEIIEKGRWLRVESSDYVGEFLCSYDRPRSDLYEGRRVFIDSRWKSPVPPVPPLKVGDTVTSVEQLDSLPIRAVVKDAADDVWQKFIGRYGGEDHWYGVGAERSISSKELLRGFSPITILWLPEAGGDDE